MATRHSNLGTLFVDLGDLASAHTHHERALEIGQATLRPNHPTMATFREQRPGPTSREALTSEWKQSRRP